LITITVLGHLHKTGDYAKKLDVWILRFDAKKFNNLLNDLLNFFQIEFPFANHC